MISLDECQAVPVAARRWGRTDHLCASHASTFVYFRGVSVPVCFMHAATYKRQGTLQEAERFAARNWGWRTSKFEEAVS